LSDGGDDSIQHFFFNKRVHYIILKAGLIDLTSAQVGRVQNGNFWQLSKFIGQTIGDVV
jgi:hypothetical protein